MREYISKEWDKETYKRVLSVARSYYSDLKKIKIIENDCIMATSRPEANGGRGSYVSDPTYSISQRIEKHTRLLRERTGTVETVLHKFKDEEQEILKQNLFEHIPLINCDTTKSEITLKRLRNDFLSLLAVELGETI